MRSVHEEEGVRRDRWRRNLHEGRNRDLLGCHKPSKKEGRKEERRDRGRRKMEGERKRKRQRKKEVERDGGREKGTLERMEEERN